MPNQFGWGLGMQGVSAFPSNFSNIGPSEQKAGSTRFTSKVPATIGVGGINSAYPSSLGLSGGAFGSREMGSRDFGSLGLPQAQAFGFGQPASFTGGGGFRGEGYSFRQPLNSMALAPQTSIPIEGGALSVGINRAQTAGQMGRTAIQTPRGTIFATDQQQANMAAPRSIDQQSSRSPQQQQALLAQIRSQGLQMAQNKIAQQEEFFKQKRAERAALAGATQEAYKSGMSPQSIRQARNEYTSQQPSSIAGIQKQFQSMVPQFGTPMAQRGSVAGIRSSFNIPTGGPQPYQASGFNTGMNFNALTPILDNNRIGNPMSFNFGYGV